MSQQKDKLDSLVAKRENIFSRVQILFDLAKTLSKENYPTFKARYEKIEDHYCDFDKIQDEISALSIKLDPADAVETIKSSTRFEELYYAVKAVGSANIKATPQPGTHLIPPHPVIRAKLPDIIIPTFKGDIKNWSNFYSLFDSRESD